MGKGEKFHKSKNLGSGTKAGISAGLYYFLVV
jgi:hypothetical protein